MTCADAPAGRAVTTGALISAEKRMLAPPAVLGVTVQAVAGNTSGVMAGRTAMGGVTRQGVAVVDSAVRQRL